MSAEAEDYDEKDDRLFLVYEYTVDGVLYRGDRIQFAGPPTIGRNNDGLSRWLVTLFGDTAHVDVYYDPARPWDAVLIAGITGTAVWELLLGILITAAVLFRW